MLANEIQLGQRVRVVSNNLTALIVGRPEYYTPRAKLVRIKYENSTRYEYMIVYILRQTCPYMLDFQCKNLELSS